MRNRILLSLFVAGLAACGPVGENPSPLPEPAATMHSSATPGPPLFAFSSPEPVLAHGEPDSWFSGVVEPGAVVQEDGQYHLFFNGFTGWPAHSSVGRAVSIDGVEWTLASAEPLLDSSREDFDGFTFFVSSVIRLDSGDWAMYLYTLDEGRDGATGGILVATSGSVDGPWILSPGYALAPGEPGAWDASRVTQPHVLKVGDEYRMYFAGYENDRLQGSRSIGLAVSQNGLIWVKRPDPVFGPSDKLGSWDAHRVFQPRVLQTGDGFLMLYKANVSVGRAEGWGFALSPDGLVWERYPGNPVIAEDTYGIELRRNGMAELILSEGNLLLYLEILEREGGGYHHGNSAYGSNIYLLRSAEIP